MHEIFEIIDHMRTAVVRGELKEAMTRATELGDNLLDSAYPKDWAPHLQRVRRAVNATRSATDLATAAVETARAGSACGHCHTKLGAQGKAGPPEPLESSSLRLTNFMNRHSWAAERLWEGLVGPSDAAWELGAKTLADTSPLDSKNMTAEMQTLAYALGEITERTAAATTTSEREKVYGEFLGTCAACHRAYSESSE